MADQPGTQNYAKSANLTADQNSRAAQTQANQAAQHEYSCEITMRGDCRMNPTLSVTIQGTQSAFDRTYQTMSVVHRISASGGYTMEITGQTDGGSGTSGDADAQPQTPSSESNDIGVIGQPPPPSLGGSGTVPVEP